MSLKRYSRDVLLPIFSKTFMTFAWYGFLKFKEYNWYSNLGILLIIGISWGIAFFEYIFRVPTN